MKTYEDQAKLSVYASIVAGLASLASVALILRNFDSEEFFVNYASGTLWLPAVAASLLVALGAGALAFFMGLYTAGQRRNKKTNLSWLAFFISAGAITIALSAAVFFVLTRNQITY